VNEATGQAAFRTMRVGVIQSCYVPWRGYFDFIASVDRFVIFDDVQYPKGRSWRNRNRLKTRQGLKWLTVPVSAKGLQAIDQVLIAPSQPQWREGHRALITESLEPAPFFRDALDLWVEGTESSPQRLSPMNVRLIRAICEYLGIATRIVNARDYAVDGAKTQRLIRLLEKIGATAYLSGPAARDYLDEELFRRHSIRLEYKTYDYPPYPQLWGDFVGAVSALDLIANVGPDSPKYLRSQTPDLPVVP
jgi:hypothetical protein